MTPHVKEILDMGYIYPLEKLHKMGIKIEEQNSMGILPFLFMTLIKKSKIGIIESLNFSFNHGSCVYLIFDSKILKDIPFNINEDWMGGPEWGPEDDEIWKKGITEEELEYYSKYLKNECLFGRGISLKKYLIEIHITKEYATRKRHKSEIIKIIEKTNEKYKNVVIKILNPKKMTQKQRYYYFWNNNSIEDLKIG